MKEISEQISWPIAGGRARGENDSRNDPDYREPYASNVGKRPKRPVGTGAPKFWRNAAATFSARNICDANSRSIARIAGG